jgi:tyrosyl-tRNA synthetase
VSDARHPTPEAAPDATSPGGTGVIDDFSWRGLVADSTDIDQLRALLESGSCVFYCGFDPTGASLHVGHLLQLITMARLQRAGHRPLVLVGGATGLIGDPKPDSERPLADAGQVVEWTARLREQMEPYFTFDGPAGARMVNNLDWTGEVLVVDFLRDVGKHFSLNRMLERDAVRNRLSSTAGLSFTEFSYVLIQANDYLHLFTEHGCRLQVGGSDQWGNITAGIDLVRRVRGEHVHGLTTPLLTNSDGSKFGKSEGGAVWLDPAMTSPYEFYQYWFNRDDRDVVRFLKALTFRAESEIAELAEAVAHRPQARQAQRELARELTTLVHGATATEAAESAAAALFGRGDLHEADPATLDAALRTAPHGVVDRGHEWPGVVDVMVASGLVPSKGAARRTIAEGGAYLNNVRISDAEAKISDAEVLAGGWVVLRRGRRNVAGVQVRA